MAKGSINDFRPTGISRRLFFSGTEPSKNDDPDADPNDDPDADNDLNAIIQAAGGLPAGEVEHRRAADDGMDLVTVRVPRRVALKERLESAARCWDVYAQYSNSPSAQQVAKNIEAILRTCDKRICSTRCENGLAA